MCSRAAFPMQSDAEKVVRHFLGPKARVMGLAEVRNAFSRMKTAECSRFASTTHPRSSLRDDSHLHREKAECKNTHRPRKAGA